MTDEQIQDIVERRTPTAITPLIRKLQPDLIGLTDKVVFRELRQRLIRVRRAFIDSGDPELKTAADRIEVQVRDFYRNLLGELSRTLNARDSDLRKTKLGVRRPAPDEDEKEPFRAKAPLRLRPPCQGPS